MAENLFDLTGKIALVTGGNSGLGYAFANGLARAGSDVVIWGRRAERNAEAENRLRAHGGRVASRVVDVTDEQQVIEAMAAAVDMFGRLDCVVANAGTATIAPIEEMTSDIWHTLLAVNLHGVFYTCREAARHMKARSERGDRGGSIILNGSLAVFAGVPGLAHYAAAKGGLNSMAKTLAAELGPYDLRVNVICPGLILTEITELDPEMTRDSVAATERKTPIKPLGRPEDLEGIVVYLASDSSRFHSGDTITLDGGLRAQNH
jgi:NAD(P)-dependent dehydrogenase (short-subunit alcohol dehydrogenase family)